MYGRAIAATLFLFLAGFLTVTACQRAGAATPLVTMIAVAGNRHIDAAMIRSHFHAGAAGRLNAGRDSEGGCPRSSAHALALSLPALLQELGLHLGE